MHTRGRKLGHMYMYMCGHTQTPGYICTLYTPGIPVLPVERVIN